MAEDRNELWLAPDLFLAQTCGYPLLHILRDRVTLVATATYAVEGCTGPAYYSVIVARRDSSLRSLDDVAGKIAAVNSYDSQSGWNALRHSLIGKGAPASIIESGGHRNSIAAVREGRADFAAIDRITFATIKAVAPHEVAPLRAIARSASAPALPYITRRDISHVELQKLRDGLHAAFADQALAETRAALLLADIEILPLRAYDRILEMEQEADSAGSLVRT